MKTIFEVCSQKISTIVLSGLLIFSASFADSIETSALNMLDKAENAVKITHIQKSNPFSAEMEIVLELEIACRAAITVCTPMDAVVRQWELQKMAAGRHVIKWDGKDDLGQSVASGVYFFKIQTQHCKKVETLALLQ